MIILDTNVFYRLCRIETDKNIDLDKLEKFVLNNKCMCSLFSLFEILNSKFSFDDKMVVLNYIAKNRIQIELTQEINNEIQSHLLSHKKDEIFYKKLKIIYGKYIITEISNNISFFIKSYAYASATIFIDNYEIGVSNTKKYFRKHFEIIQKDIDKHIEKIINIYLNKLLDEDNFNADSVQKMLLCVIANLMTYYYELLKYTKEIFENKDKNAYYKVINKFKKLKNKLLNDTLQDVIDYDYQYLNVCKIIIDESLKSNELQKIKPGKIKTFFINKIMDSIYFVNLEMRNEFEEKWLKRNISSLFVESSKIKPNDFLDYEILRELFYYSDRDLIITFDNKMKNILKDVSSNQKFIDSLNLIESFKI